MSDTINTGAENLTSLIGTLAAPAVGIDFTKSFNYGGNAPQHDISFFLDNTKDETYGKNKGVFKKKKNKELPKISQPNSTAKIDKLQLLINKFESGNISRDEFNRQKKKLLQK